MRRDEWVGEALAVREGGRASERASMHCLVPQLIRVSCRVWIHGLTFLKLARLE